MFGVDFQTWESGWSFGVAAHFLDEYDRRETYTDKFFMLQIMFGSYMLEFFLENKKEIPVEVNIND